MHNIIKTLLALSFLATILLAKQAILKLDAGSHTGILRDIIVTQNQDIISESENKDIRVWDKNGIEKRKILGQIGSGNEGMTFAIALSANEKYLAVGGFMAKGGGFNDDNVGNIRIYNYSTGKIVKILKSHLDVVLDLAFSEDSRYLISGSGDNTAKIWNVTDDFILEETISFHTNSVYATKIIKKQNKYFCVTAGYDNVIALYDIENKKIVSSDKSHYKLNFLATSTSINHGHIAVCGEGKEIRIYDFDLSFIKSIQTNTIPKGLAYSKNGDYLIAGTAVNPSNVNVYKSKKNYHKKTTFTKHTNLVQAVEFLDNDTAISAGGNNNEIYIWNIHTGKIESTIEGVGNSIWAVGINGDNIAWRNTSLSSKQLKNYTAQFQKSINIKNFKIFNKTDDFKRISTTNANYSLNHSKGGKYGLKDAILNITKDGRLEAKIIKNNSDGYSHRCYGWYKDFIVSGGSGGQIHIYNKEAEKIASLIGHTGEIWSIALDNDRLVSGGSDQILKVWDLSVLKNKAPYNEKLIKEIMSKFNITRDKVLKQAKYNNINIYLEQKIYPTISLFISKNNEYVAYTNEGFFNASKNGAKYIGYHINQGQNKEAEYVTVDALYSTFYRPDLIQKALAGESLKKYAKNINIQRLLQDGLAPEVHILTKTKNSKNQDLDLKVQVCTKGSGGYDNLTLLINDMPVSVIDTSRALKLKQKSKRDDCFIYDQTISLAGGLNNIGFRATNKAGNIESKPDFLEVTFDDTNLKKKLRSKLAKISGSQNINDLHILAIAVNEYKDTDLTLKYSINDASAMLSTIQDVAKPLFNKVHTYKLFDTNVTKENIKQAFKNIKSAREDVFLLYIAGHGITDEYNGNYYYIPYDFINKDDEKAVQVQGIGQKDLMFGLSNITALKSLVLLDTCNSGSFVEANMQKTTTGRLARATGRATISASSKSQVALEGYKGHGVFTYTLIEALKGKGYNDDKKITINELNDYVEDTLPDRTNQKWGYRQMPQSSMHGTDFNIGMK